MKKILFILAAFAVSVPSSQAGAGGAARPEHRQLKKYAMDSDYFSCGIPAGWTMERDKARDAEYKIYEIALTAPQPAKTPVTIHVSYYAKDNADFDGYEDFIARNSQNVLGETKSERETYEPVKKIKLNGRPAAELSRAKTAYLHPENKSDESVKLKEKLYVLPARNGFYVLHFTASETAFPKYLKVFEQVAGSFKGNP